MDEKMWQHSLVFRKINHFDDLTEPAVDVPNSWHVSQTAWGAWHIVSITQSTSERQIFNITWRRLLVKDEDDQS